MVMGFLSFVPQNVLKKGVVLLYMPIPKIEKRENFVPQNPDKVIVLYPKNPRILYHKTPRNSFVPQNNSVPERVSSFVPQNK